MLEDFEFPAWDKHCKAACLKEYKSLDAATEHVKDRCVAVQAGGNCGVFPAYLAESFRRVYTFEPQGELFRLMCKNLNEVGNVWKYHAAVGDRRGCVSLETEADNAGSAKVWQLSSLATGT